MWRIDELRWILTAKDALEQALHDGLPGFRLIPGLSEREVREFEKRQGAPLSSEAREVLLFASGFTYEPFGGVTFLGKDDFTFPSLFPKAIALAGDGSGNFWVLDVREDSGAWGRVLFVSHDPPVVVVQAADLAQYVHQVLAVGRSDDAQELDEVATHASLRIWREDPDLIDVVAARQSADPMLSKFAAELPDAYRIADLRNAGRGTGFTWGRNGPQTDVRRFDSELLFGIEPKRGGSFINRVLGRKR